MDNNSNPFDEEKRGTQSQDDNAPVFLPDDGNQQGGIFEAEIRQIVTPTNEKRKGRLIPFMMIIGFLILGYFLLTGIRYVFNLNRVLTPIATQEPKSTSIFETVTIIANEDFSSSYPYIEELATDWESPLIPSKLTFHIEVNKDQSVDISRGWCTTTEDILEENLSHIEWLLAADGKSIDVNTLYQGRFIDDTSACEYYDGLVMKWSEGEHIITFTMRIDQEINDGWEVFPAGEYIEVFIINVPR